jgi:hypothetical protein
MIEWMLTEIADVTDKIKADAMERAKPLDAVDVLNAFTLMRVSVTTGEAGCGAGRAPLGLLDPCQRAVRLAALSFFQKE